MDFVFQKYGVFKLRGNWATKPDTVVLWPETLVCTHRYVPIGTILACASIEAPGDPSDTRATSVPLDLLNIYTYLYNALYTREIRILLRLTYFNGETSLWTKLHIEIRWYMEVLVY